MSESDIRAALESHLKEISAPTAAAWPTAYENVTFEEPDSRQFQRCWILFSPTVAAGVGRQAGEKWTGLLQINVTISANKGAGPAEARLKELRSHFPRGQALIKNGVRVICETPYAARSPVEEPNKYTRSFYVPWFCYTP